MKQLIYEKKNLRKGKSLILIFVKQIYKTLLSFFLDWASNEHIFNFTNALLLHFNNIWYTDQIEGKWSLFIGIEIEIKNFTILL